jgi:protein-disulfide isomerase
MTVLSIARRAAVLAVAAFALTACNKGSGSAVGTADDMTQGQASAPVTVIEYASTSCPHCAKYESEDFPALKAKYIDTGKVRYVFRETPIHPTYDGPAFLLARCVGKDKYFKVIEAMMRDQTEYLNPALPESGAANAYRAVLMRVAEAEGLSDAAAMKCMSDEDAAKKLQDRSEAESKQYNVSGTPTFVVNGKKVDQPEGVEMSNALVFPAIDQALGQKKG